MKFLVHDENPVEHVCQVLVVGCFEDDEQEPFFTVLDEKLGGYLSALIRRKEFSGALNKVKQIPTLGRITPESVLLMGLGKKKELSAEKVRQASGTAVQSLPQSGVASLSVLIPGGIENVPAAVEGFALGGYSFVCYKTKPDS